MGRKPGRRAYELSHPWIDFTLDLRRLNFEVWLLLGEAAALCEEIASAPLKPSAAERLHRVYLAKGVSGTTAIEGNTLTEREIQDRIEGRLRLPKSKEYLGREVDNVVGAFNEVRKRVIEDAERTVNVPEILDFNRRVLAGLEVAPDVRPGEIRLHSVGVARYRGAPAEDCDHLLERLCAWLNDEAAWRVGPPVVAGLLRAVVGHLYVAWIHPFGDGNGRTARLLELKLLLAAGTPTPAVHLLSNFYNETREEYYRALDRANREPSSGVAGFIAYAVRGFVDAARDQARTIRGHLFDVAWDAHVYESFGDQPRETGRRRRRLMLAMSDRSGAEERGPIPAADVSMLSPRIAAEYARLSAKTLSRDLDALVEMGLLRESAQGYAPNRDRLRAFMPPRA
ncbi:MAG: Fic family protein, partial [Candidatus Methylomirabilis sp.]|nr:Fic family protein [Deltaproteobacteria bacterium]